MAMINVLIVDDSAVVRQAIGAALSRDRGINVIGAVADPLFAMQRMKMDWPDVIVLDVEMPRMDGITFLKKIMAERPTPVVICSTLTPKGAETTMMALVAGAVAIVAKPKVGIKAFLLDDATDLAQVVKAAARANVKNLLPAGGAPLAARIQDPSTKAGLPDGLRETTDRIVAIGTSTGGTQALESVLSALPRVTPGIVVVQHMPEKFTAAFAQRLDSVCQIEVREAQNGDRVIAGRALVAPGGKHMQLTRSGAQYHVEVRDGPVVNRHRPSVDVLFRSVAHHAAKNSLGIIMTGMGDDGARGLKEMHEAGARTLAQDEKTCVVFGMPKEAIKLDCIDRVLPLHAIAQEISAFTGS
ncbi:MAG: chemotaxis response regulator protein-glutamate methylesterase [Betaproteobacteria bacterium]|nr:chemotaxis response regulator protein-glutamate methylesterase [Betaproteobacteria bacterium]